VTWGRSATRAPARKNEVAAGDRTSLIRDFVCRKSASDAVRVRVTGVFNRSPLLTEARPGPYWGGAAPRYRRVATEEITVWVHPRPDWGKNDDIRER